MVHAVFTNLNDNVPFSRAYKTFGQFLKSYKRMIGVSLDYALDYDNLRLIREGDI